MCTGALPNLRNYNKLNRSRPRPGKRAAVLVQALDDGMPGLGLNLVVALSVAPVQDANNWRTLMMRDLAKLLWRNDEGQDIAEYAVMLAVILVIVIGTIRLIGGNANNVFSAVASGISQ